MTPVRTPDLVRGDVPGLLCRGMPCVGRNTDPFVISEPHGQDEYAEWAVIGTGHYRKHAACVVDWTDRAAILLSVAWLADRGHACTRLLPATHDGKVTEHAGLDAWAVSAILVARSVGRVARGLGPIVDVAGVWREDPNTFYRKRMMASFRVWVFQSADYLLDGNGWALGRPTKRTPRGPETGPAGKLAADRAALADGVALCDPAGILLPDLEPA